MFGWVGIGAVVFGGKRIEVVVGGIRTVDVVLEVWVAIAEVVEPHPVKNNVAARMRTMP